MLMRGCRWDRDVRAAINLKRCSWIIPSGPPELTHAGHSMPLAPLQSI